MQMSEANFYFTTEGQGKDPIVSPNYLCLTKNKILQGLKAQCIV